MASNTASITAMAGNEQTMMMSQLSSSTIVRMHLSTDMLANVNENRCEPSWQLGHHNMLWHCHGTEFVARKFCQVLHGGVRGVTAAIGHIGSPSHLFPMKLSLPHDSCS